MIYVLYHGVDHDGHCSGAVVRWYLESGYKYELNKDFKMVPIDYGMSFDTTQLTADDKVYMVDFTLQPYEKTIEVHKKCTLIVIDHHKTNADILKAAGVQGVYGKGAHAACYLTWTTLIGTKIPETVQLLSDYDNWNNQDTEYWEKQVLPFHYATGVVETDPCTVEGWENWKTIFSTPPSTEHPKVLAQIELGNTIMRYQDIQNSATMQDSFEMTFEGYRFLVMNGGRGANTFKSKYDPDKHDAFMSFRLHQNKYWTVSMYTFKDIDLSLIATKWGGGGHAKACGFQVDDITKVIGPTKRES